MSPSRAGRLLLPLCFLHLTSRASSSNLWFENLPDGIHDVLIGPNGGIYLTGFDSRRRVCLVLFAPPFGRPLLVSTSADASWAPLTSMALHLDSSIPK